MIKVITNSLGSGDWIHTLGVANLLRCEKCGKWLTPARHEHLHGEREL
jgi:hypothetical protein